MSEILGPEEWLCKLRPKLIPRFSVHLFPKHVPKIGHWRVSDKGKCKISFQSFNITKTINFNRIKLKKNRIYFRVILFNLLQFLTQERSFLSKEISAFN